MPGRIAILPLAALGLMLAACSSGDVRDTIVSATGNTIRGNCERAGNCEVYCKREGTIKTHDGRCVGE